MSTVLLILRKDLRHLWVLSSLGVLFSLFATLGWYWDLSRISTSGFIFFAGQVAPIVVLFVLSVAIVQSDPTVGDRAFWRTRPISPGALLVAKLLVLCLVFALPSLLVNLFLAVSMDTPFPVLLGMVIESTGMILIECLVSALVGAVTRSLMQAAAAVLASALLLMAVAVLNPLPQLFVPWRMDIPGHAPRMAAMGVYSGIAALILLAHQFLTRRRVRTLVLLVASVPAVLFASVRWPVSIRSTSPTEAETPAKLETSAGVQMMLMPPAVTWSTSYVNNPATGKTVKAHTVAMNAAMRSIPEGRIIQIDSITSALRFPGGEELQFQPIGRAFWPYWSSLTQATAISRELGLAPPAPSKEQAKQPRLRLFTVPNEKAVALAGKRGTLTVTLKLYELAFHQVASLPARPGAHWTRDGEMWRVAKISFEKGAPSAVLEHLRATSILINEGPARPDYRPDGYRFGLALHNKKRGEFALSTFRWFSMDLPQWTIDRNDRIVTFSEAWKVGGSPVDHPIDESWLADAELVILSAVPVGSFEKQLVLENFEIPQSEEMPESEAAPYWQ